MRRFQVPGQDPKRSAAGISKGEKRRLIVLSVCAALVLAGFFYGTWEAQKRGGSEHPEELPADVAGGYQEKVDVPAIDRAGLDALVHDETEEERVLWNAEAVGRLLEIARNLTPRHYEVLGERELDAAARQELEADPSAHRGAAYLVRGWIDTIRTRHDAALGEDEHVGRIQIRRDGEEGEQAYVYFVALDVPPRLIEGDYVRFDGLFLKRFSDESTAESGKWLQGPLLVGRRIERSMPAFGPVTQLDPIHFADVRDADVNPPDGSPPILVRTPPSEALWNLMAYARDVPPGTVDWDSARVLDNAALEELASDPAANRLRPYRIPISHDEHTSVLLAGENPARIREYTDGWIGNTTWKNVVHFNGPFQARDARIGDLIVARGFFLQNLSYTPAGHGVRVAPFFVLQSLEVVNPQPAPIFGILIGAMAIGSLIFIGGFIALVLRDSRRAKRLQEDLIRRRRERRARRGPVTGSSPRS